MSDPTDEELRAAGRARMDAARAAAATVMPPFVRHSVTSRDAAASIRSSTSSLRERVYAWLAANGPATDERMQDALAMNPSTQRPRRVELVAEGRVTPAGRGKTKSGRQAMLWRTQGGTP